MYANEPREIKTEKWTVDLVIWKPLMIFNKSGCIGKGKYKKLLGWIQEQIEEEQVETVRADYSFEKFYCKGEIWLRWKVT